MKKTLFIGAVGSGKTSLCQNLKGEEVRDNKTQAVEYYTDLVDTPGEFIQHRHYYQALQTLAFGVERIALVLSVQDTYQVFPPSFAQNFPVFCIGIVTKIDLNHRKEDLAFARQQLVEAGAKQIFEVSSVTNDGMNELITYLGLK